MIQLVYVYDLLYRHASKPPGCQAEKRGILLPDFHKEKGQYGDPLLKLPKTAYILLWFPKPSETFVFREVTDLQKMGLSLKVFTLYGNLTRDLSPEMRSASIGVERLGISYLKDAYSDLIYWCKKNPKKVIGLLKSVFVNRWYGFEKTGENLWAFFCAFRLSRRFEEEGIEHIHAPWACGPATAAWIASKLTGIPFSFTARAWDISPPDGLLKDKMRDSIFVRTNNTANVDYLRQFADGNTDKIHMIYNGLPLNQYQAAPVKMAPPYRLLALGRLVPIKGYIDLIMACKIIQNSGVDFRLVLAGDGPLRRRLKRLTRRMGLDERILFPGFVTHDRISRLFYSADVFLMPSRVASSGDKDGIPNVILEALMHNVPVVASRISGIPEVIEDGATGILVPERDPAAIARAVIRLVSDRDGALKMAKRGRSRVLEMFDSQQNFMKVLQLFSVKG